MLNGENIFGHSGLIHLERGLCREQTLYQAQATLYVILPNRPS